MAEVYRLDEGDEKLARDVLDPLRKLRNEFDRLVQAKEKIVQAEDHPAGTLTVRSDNAAGQITLNAGHGIVTGQVFNLYFSGGSRAGVIAGTVDGNNVPISGGTGDNLPAQDAAVTVTHYGTAAAELGAKSAGGSIDANVAYKAANELASMISVCEAALKQCAARIVSY